MAMSSSIFSIADEMPPRSERRVAGGRYLSAVFVSLASPPLGFLEPEEEATASILDVRDLRFDGEEVPGEVWRVRGADLTDGESSDPLSSAGPSSCEASCSLCCLAKAAAAADPGGGGVGILDPEATGTGLLRDILLRGFAHAPVMERFMVKKEQSWNDCAGVVMAPSTGAGIHFF